MSEILSMTKSLCPTCLQVLPAKRVLDGEDVFIEKTCPDHGDFRTILWRGLPSYEDWGTGEEAPGPRIRQTKSVKGCPNDCGLCPAHQAQTCTVLMEVTSRCDLKCPVCFASSNEVPDFHPDLNTLREMLEAILAAGGPYPLQLSGGEPTVRNDLPEIVSMAKSMGFYHVQINTHGLRLAKDKQYLLKLKEAGADLIYLQFDGVSDDIYEKVRGARLLELKEEAIENCADVKLGVQLVPTLVPDINGHQIGGIIQFAKKYIPIVKGVHFQPVSYFGRYPSAPSDDIRITTPDVLRALESQTEGEIKASNFLPRRRRDAHCGFSGFFVLDEGDKLSATTSFTPGRSSTARCREVAGCSAASETPSEHVRRFINEKSRFIEPNPGRCACEQQQSFQAFLERARTHYLSISGMPFQDVWTIDLERLQGCCIHVMSPQKKLVPFCAYYLTDITGRRLPGKVAGAAQGVL